MGSALVIATGVIIAATVAVFSISRGRQPGMPAIFVATMIANLSGLPADVLFFAGYHNVRPGWSMILAAVALISTGVVFAKSTPTWRGAAIDCAVISLSLALIVTCAIQWRVGPDITIDQSHAILAMAMTMTIASFLSQLGKNRSRYAKVEGRLLTHHSYLRIAAWGVGAYAFAVHSHLSMLIAQAIWILGAVPYLIFYGIRTRAKVFVATAPPSAPQPGRVPYLFATMALGAVFSTMFLLEQPSPPVLLMLCAIGVCLIVARQLVTFHDFQVLSDAVVEKERNYRYLVQNSSDVIMVCDPADGRTKYISPAAERMLNITQDQVGIGLHETLRADQRVVMCVLERLTPHSGPQRIESQYDDRCLEAVATRHEHQILVSVRDVTEREHMRKTLHRLAFIDPLTGLANRHHILGQAERMLLSDPSATALLFIDLDRFKQVNDAGGHEMGDRVLTEVAERIQAVVHDTTHLGRIGGDEFVAIVDRRVCDPDETALRITQTLQAPFEVSGRVYQLGGSVGIAIPDGPVEAAELMRRADVAMYAAKRQGVACVVYEPGMTTATIEGVDRDACVAKALRQREFELHFQPIVDMASGHVVSVESLVRWVDDRGQAQGPGQLIDFAQRTGQMQSITNWVLQATLEHLRGADESVSASINIPPMDMLNPLLVSNLTQLLASYQVDPHRIILEITEDEVIGRSHRTLGVLSDLHRLGVRVVIDDFGSGYSSLGYLVDLPLDGFKVDRRFVAALPFQASARSIMKSLVQLAQDNDLTIVAEGIENQLEHHWVSTLGCPASQGFYYARPQSAQMCGDLASLERWGERTCIDLAAEVTWTGAGAGPLTGRRPELNRERP